jgi:dephospho-CoA kinase
MGKKGGSSVLVTVIGLTGGMGSGKSTASRLLGELGAEVIDADQVGHRIYLPETPAWREIVEAFGKEVLAADGSIDRRKLGPIVFGEAQALQTLNRITHGKIFAYIQGQIDYMRQHTPDRIVVVEAAILLEAGWRVLVEQLWVVVATEEVVIARLQASKRFTAEQVRARLNAQLTNDARMAQADRVIWNNAGFQELRQAVEEAWRSLR